MIEIPKILFDVLTFIAGLSFVGLWYLGMKELVKLLTDVWNKIKEFE